MSEAILNRLFEMQDIKYGDFTARLCPDLDREKFIGVRAPQLQSLSKQLLKSGGFKEFLQELPHRFYEENNLHAAVISRIKNYGECMDELERFLPYIDNWATCDGLRPPVFKKHLPELSEKIDLWLKSSDTYTLRFALSMLMVFYLDEAFTPQVLDKAAGLRSDEYYVNMMLAWFFASALAKQYESTLPYIEKGVLDKWTHNKTIQKARESRRVSEAQKEYLKTLKK